MLGYGAALSVVVAAFTYTGGRLNGYYKDPTVDEVSRKEYLRKNRRRPVDQIVNELGEGRGAYFRLRRCRLGSGPWPNANIHTGIYAPGYEERRAQRIKEAYGIDVPVKSAS